MSGSRMFVLRRKHSNQDFGSLVVYPKYYQNICIHLFPCYIWNYIWFISIFDFLSLLYNPSLPQRLFISLLFQRISPF